MRSPVWIGTFFAVLASCGAPGGPVGTSRGTPFDAPQPEPSATQAKVPEGVLPSDFRSTFTRLGPRRFSSRGHLYERFVADVYASAGVREALREHRPFAPGAVLIKEQFDRVSGQGAGILVMEKRAGFDPERGDWRYVVVGGGGGVVQEGKLAVCAGCHKDAPRDYVFPIVE
ncbi:MAG: cytochrome P460 family protein [Myxococcales bacterium]